MMNLPRPLRGIIPPVLTPLSGRDELDAPAFESLLEHLIAGGSSALFILGNARVIGSIYGTNTYPVTYQVLEFASGTFGLFVLIGALPHTEWLQGQLATDRAGFLLTGRDLPDKDLVEFNGDLPYFLETSRPGIFAVGDVHSGSIKRVASAVGEGSMAVRLVHQRLAAPEPRPANRSSSREGEDV